MRRGEQITNWIVRWGKKKNRIEREKQGEFKYYL